MEQIAIDRAKEVFGAEAANVQPHSGASANMAVYLAFLNPGDTILGMDLSQGGHLTHGSPVSISGKYFNAVHYGVQKDTELLDYDRMEALAKEHKPKLLVGGASAYPRVIDFERMAQIAKSVDALLLIDMAHIAGLVAAGLHPSPVPHADFVTTTTHKTLRGPRGGLILCKEEHAKAINKAVFPGLQGGPLMHVIAAKAVALKEALSPDYKQYQAQVVANASAFAEVSKHMDLKSLQMVQKIIRLMDSQQRLTEKVAEEALDEVGIANKNAVPFDTESPFITVDYDLVLLRLRPVGLKRTIWLKLHGLLQGVIESRRQSSLQSSWARHRGALGSILYILKFHEPCWVPRT